MVPKQQTRCLRNTTQQNNNTTTPHHPWSEVVTTNFPPPPPRGPGWCGARVTAVIAWGKRPVPFRTRKLRPTAPMVLHPGGCGRVGHRRNTIKWSRPPNTHVLGGLPHLNHPPQHRPPVHPTRAPPSNPHQLRERPPETRINCESVRRKPASTERASGWGHSSSTQHMHRRHTPHAWRGPGLQQRHPTRAPPSHPTHATERAFAGNPR